MLFLCIQVQADGQKPDAEDGDCTGFADKIHFVAALGDQAENSLIVVVVGGMEKSSRPYASATYGKNPYDDAYRKNAEQKCGDLIPEGCSRHISPTDQQRDMPAAPE